MHIIFYVFIQNRNIWNNRYIYFFRIRGQHFRLTDLTTHPTKKGAFVTELNSNKPSGSNLETAGFLKYSSLGLVLSPFWPRHIAPARVSPIGHEDLLVVMAYLLA